jgi:hypothetical protein
MKKLYSVFMNRLKLSAAFIFKSLSILYTLLLRFMNLNLTCYSYIGIPAAFKSNLCILISSYF